MRGIIILLFCFLFVPSVLAHKHDDGSHSHRERAYAIQNLSNTLTLISGVGGNVLVSVGRDGVMLIDNGLSDKTEALEKAIKEITKEPVRFMVNTHWHFDHTGNNPLLGKNKATILAHENVRTRLKNGGVIEAFDATIDPAETEALPVITYQDTVKIHLHDEDIEIHALSPSHTDGDSFIWFPQQNIVHTGDIFFNGFWPFIDASSGGTLQGMITATEKILGTIRKDTVIVPGHGPLATYDEFQTYLLVLKDIQSRVQAAKGGDMSKEEWVNNNPLADLDEEWGDGILPTEKFTAILWDVAQN